MSYCHVLIHTARAIPILLIDRSLWRSIRIHTMALTIDICELVGRVGALLLFPVAVPIVAVLIVASMRREGWEQECTSRGIETTWTRDSLEPSEAGKLEAIASVMSGENGRLTDVCRLNRYRNKTG